MSNAAGSPRPGNAWLRPDGIPVLLALTGLSLYAVLNVAAVLFYAPLGVTPREVGLGYTDLLAQAVAGLVAAGVATVVLFAGFVAVTFGWSNVGAVRSHGGVVGPAATVAVVLSVLGMAWAVWALLSGAGLGVAFGRALLSTAPMLLLGVYALQQIGQQMQREGRRFARPLMRVLAVLVFVSGAFGVLNAALFDTRAVQSGQDPDGLWGLPVPWSAEPATVQWAHSTATTQRPALPRCAVFLGAADGTSILFDDDAQGAMRVPSAAVVISRNPEVKRC